MKTLQELKETFDKALERENAIRENINTLRRQLTVACRERNHAYQDWWAASREVKKEKTDGSHS